MIRPLKNQKEILKKLGIEALNPMQIEAQAAIHANDEVILLSPTGTGKTLAFLLPVIAQLQRELHHVQLMILVPARELAIQIEQVIREMGTGMKANAVYGGQAFSKDKIELKHEPAILIGTPGRVAHHVRKRTFSIDHIHTLILDEFDKSLEIGFEDDMADITNALYKVKKKILTSATKELELPDFIKLNKPEVLDFLQDGIQRLRIKRFVSPDKDKLETLAKALCHLGNQPGIIFCNYKDSIQRVSTYLNRHNIPHGCFYGAMEQRDRERALIKFRNGTHQLIIATDLAARGIDIDEIGFIIHYHLPLREQEFIHRNGRTARMHSDGTAYVLHWEEEELPEFIPECEEEEIVMMPIPKASEWETVFVSGGRKDKISKGDIAGLFIKQGNLTKDEIGMIELKQDCAFVAVHKSKAKQLIELLNNTKLKKRKVRIYLI